MDLPIHLNPLLKHHVASRQIVCCKQHQCLRVLDHTLSMPDNKTVGWRQKIHGKPKDAPLPKLTIDDATSADDLRDRRRHGWRKTLHTGSRPVTPISTTPTTPTVQDVEDHHSETSETTTPRRNSKPKLIRYTSLFSSYKDSARRSDSFNAPDFVEPWSDNTPFSFQPYVDPLVAIQSIRAHMTSSLNPIPLQHNNNLFCVFEDYRRLRHQHEHLEASLLERSKEFEEMTEHWVTEEQKYQAEIRRLELLIARGESGVAG